MLRAVADAGSEPREATPAYLLARLRKVSTVLGDCNRVMRYGDEVLITSAAAEVR